MRPCCSRTYLGNLLQKYFFLAKNIILIFFNCSHVLNSKCDMLKFLFVQLKQGQEQVIAYEILCGAPFLQPPMYISYRFQAICDGFWLLSMFCLFRLKINFQVDDRKQNVECLLPVSVTKFFSPAPMAMEQFVCKIFTKPCQNTHFLWLSLFIFLV